VPRYNRLYVHSPGFRLATGDKAFSGYMRLSDKWMDAVHLVHLGFYIAPVSTMQVGS
jgi:hypothetical protein